MDAHILRVCCMENTHGFVLLEALEALELEETEHEELDGCEGQGGDGVILEAGIVPDWGDAQELLSHDASHCCHSPAAIDFLSLSIPGQTVQVLLISPQR